MLSLPEIEAVVDQLPPEQQRELITRLATRIDGLKTVSSGSVSNGKGGHSVLDIPSFSMGEILKPFSSDDDLLEEMLEDRRF